MKIDFDKFNLSQKIYAVFGVIFGILLYMLDKDQLNIAIGTVLLTAVIVFLLKYQPVKIWINISLLVFLSWAVYSLYELNLPKVENHNNSDTIIPIEQLPQDQEQSKIYSVRTFKGEFLMNTKKSIFTYTQIIPQPTEEACLAELKKIWSGQTFSNCVKDDLDQNYGKYFEGKATGDWYFSVLAKESLPIVMVVDYGPLFDINNPLGQFDIFNKQEWTFEEKAKMLKEYGQSVASAAGGEIEIQIFSPNHEI